jgi:hypothetical protein
MVVATIQEDARMARTAPDNDERASDDTFLSLEELRALGFDPGDGLVELTVEEEMAILLEVLPIEMMARA